jgi:hypothetical protein
MPEEIDAIRLQLRREASHWIMAASQLDDLDNFAAPEAWDGLEQYLGIAIRQRLDKALENLHRQAAALRLAVHAAQTIEMLDHARLQLIAFRRHYLRTETTLEFFTDAINTRTNPEISALMRACDSLARRSMLEALEPLGKHTPFVLTYLDKGLGASIMKAGLRLWDGNVENPAAMIKIVRHNLYRPTSLIHEAGHQVAHITGWNEELTAALQQSLAQTSSELAETWSSWATEIAADGFAFVHTGYASVVGLHDVVSEDNPFVFRFTEGDPHPISYLRVLLGIEMCRQFYQAGPWDELAAVWKRNHPLEKARSSLRPLLQQSIDALEKIVTVVLRQPMRAFGGRSLAAHLDPMRVSPAALEQLEREVGAALMVSSHWVHKESLRILALTGYRAASTPERMVEALQQQKAWMLRLGTTLEAV